jgi:hypothetical protein
LIAAWLKLMGKEEMLAQVLEEISRVRSEMGPIKQKSSEDALDRHDGIAFVSYRLGRFARTEVSSFGIRDIQKLHQRADIIAAFNSPPSIERHAAALDIDDGLGEHDKFLFDVTVLHWIVRMA